MRTAPSPSSEEAYCSWYGDAREGILYFGAAAFWSAFRALEGDPTGDLRRPGPQLVGRFDLEEERFLAPLRASPAAALSGTWDVLAHPNGRVYFTTFFEAAGYVDPASGAVERFEEAGPGLTELALLPDGGLLASRYAPPGGGSGSVVVLDQGGRVVTEHPLAGSTGWSVAPKTVAFDPKRREIWVTTDLLSQSDGVPRHDARVLDAASGREKRRIETPEIQFVLFEADGSGYLAEVANTRLGLRILPTGGERPEERGQFVLLDDTFPHEADFVQELRRSPEGLVVATRWSGRVHLVDAAGRVQTIALPRPDPDGLYYTAVLHDGRVCATYCAGVRVVCAATP